MFYPTHTDLKLSTLYWIIPNQSFGVFFFSSLLLFLLEFAKLEMVGDIRSSVDISSFMDGFLYCSVNMLKNTLDKRGRDGEFIRLFVGVTNGHTHLLVISTGHKK